MRDSVGPHRRSWVARLALTAGLALFTLLALLLLLQIDSLADRGDLYVDGAAGADTPTCGKSTVPCQTISYTLGTRASSGDTIAIARGTYTENLQVTFPVTLEGGYSGVPDWIRDVDEYETIIDGSSEPTTAAAWDGKEISFPMVIYDEGTYKMWYNGRDLDDTSRIGYATSLDGLNWTKHGANPVLDVGGGGAWDAEGVESPYVIKEGPTSYKMWYMGLPDEATGYATSTDGIAWTKHPSNPVIAAGAQDWNNLAAVHPSVLFEEGIYKMWLYTAGNPGDGPAPWISYVTSTNGIDWVWHAANPLFGHDGENWLWGPEVVKVTDEYQMWHGSASAGGARIRYATSPEGITWARHEGSVLKGDPGAWDEHTAANPSVLYAGGTYTMYYGGKRIGLATSNEGITWTKHISNPVLTPGLLANWGEPTIKVFGSAAGSVFDGLTIIGGDGQNAGGIDAGGVFDIVIRGCTIRDNLCQNPEVGSGGVYAGGGLAIVDTRLLNNEGSAPDGASAVRGDCMSMVNVLLTGNHGAPPIHSNGGVSLTNVTMALNENGSIVWNPQAPVSITIRNSIFFDERPFDFPEDCVEASTCLVTYSSIVDGWEGEGNMPDDPNFVDPDNGDFHLQAESPCIDAGTTDGAPARDLDGKRRDAAPDMGVFEWGWKVFLPLTLRGG